MSTALCRRIGEEVMKGGTISRQTVKTSGAEYELVAFRNKYDTAASLKTEAKK